MGDKTEAATPKRRSEARKKGQVAKSREVSSMSVLLGVLMVLHATIANAATLVMAYFKDIVSHLGKDQTTVLTAQTVMRLAGGFWLLVAQALAPMLLAAMVLGIAVNIAQTGPIWATEALAWDFNKLNPATGLKRFASPASAVELVKSLYKIGIVGYIAYSTIYSSYPALLLTCRADLMAGIPMVAEMAYNLAIRIVMTMLVLAALDYAYQRWQFEKNLRMSKEEIRQERKNDDGNPEIKGRIRAKQRAMAKKRMMAEVPTADVIVTNPTHFAVALKYDPKTMRAPILVAKGQDLIALKIRELAQENNVPIVENPPLARTLFKNGSLGREIPGDLYEAVAEVLAFVYQINQKRNPNYNNINNNIDNNR